KIERAVVVQIAKLRAKTPAAHLNVHRAREIVVLNPIALRSIARHPEIVSLDQNAVFRNIRNVDRVTPLIEDVADGRTHAALRGETNASLFPCFAKVLAVVEVQLGDAVVVRDEKILIADPSQ